jgi:hypothetical protein
MGLLIQVTFWVLVGLTSVLVCGGLLTILCTVLPLARRQRAALWGVK